MREKREEAVEWQSLCLCVGSGQSLTLLQSASILKSENLFLFSLSFMRSFVYP